MRFVVLCLLLLTAAPAWALESIGRVAAVQGAAEIIRADERLAVTPGIALELDDRVVTSVSGRVLLQLDGGLTVTVAPGTELRLAELRGAPAGLTAWLDLLRGLVRAVLTAPGTTNDVEVRTPIAVTSVRSTEWTVEHRPAHTAVFCRDGVVDVAAVGGTVTLAAGDGTDVRGDAPPSAPVAWGAPRIADTLARTSFARP